MRTWVTLIAQLAPNTTGSRCGTSVEDYFRGIQPGLAFTERPRVVLELLWQVRPPVPAAGLSRDLFLHASAALLPDWASRLLGRTRRRQLQAQLAARALWSIAPVFRTALKDASQLRLRAHGHGSARTYPLALSCRRHGR